MVTDSHFDISAAVVRQLGDELVSDEVTALVELVKNAYDADADFAHVVVNTADAPAHSDFPGTSGFISIDDNGVGMDRGDIDRGWLVISLSGKREMKAKGVTTAKGRTPLGDKGLGRLSTQKLGARLEMDTRKEGSETLHVAFSWDSFTEDKSLSAVPVTVRKADQPRLKGTRLLITGLRNTDVWKGAAVEQLANDLAQILSPYEKARTFLVTLTIDGKVIDLGQISERVRRAAVGRFAIDFTEGKLHLDGKVRLAKLRGNQRDEELEFFENVVVPSNGRDFYEYLKGRSPPVNMRMSADPAYFVEFDYSVELESLGSIDRLQSKANINSTSDDKDAEPVMAADPGPFHAEIDEFLLRNDEGALRLSGLSASSEIQRVVKRHAGIKVFRDGFAVKPYGINGEDWLRLGAQQTSASSWYGLRPHNVLGFVSISEARNAHLKDKTDREGFVSNAYAQNFRRLMVHSTELIGQFYEWIRRNYTKYREERLAKGYAFEGAEREITSARQVARTLKSYTARSKSIDNAAAEVQQKVEALTTRIAAEPLLSTAEERRLAPLLEAANEALRSSQSIFSEMEKYASDTEKLASVVAALSPRLEIVNTQLQDFSELAGLGLIAESLAHEVHNQTDRLTQRARAAIDEARRDGDQNGKLVRLANDVLSTASALRRQIAHLGPTLRVQRDRVELFSIADFMGDTKAYFEERWHEDSIAFDLNVVRDFDVETNRGRLLQVFDNLLLNSEYWIKQERTRNNKERLGVLIEIEHPFVRISDNGPGIDPSVESNLFEPFVTLKPKAMGRGLGLFISSQILGSMGSSINLLHARNVSGRRHVFEIDLSGVARKV
ncbi:ATP-binding protein [Sphingobium cloacae]|uniref:histidine kinase n=1 Tax=Sphingobium cloacae TaxID=120107 RepID=A0A1E1F3L1_9SPHN|nr:ATP-binding protein [Sphingobium cloacae]BAV65108.1 ATP-binding domain-containing protein [Sphingobium cloacae]